MNIWPLILFVATLQFAGTTTANIPSKEIDGVEFTLAISNHEWRIPNDQGNHFPIRVDIVITNRSETPLFFWNGMNLRLSLIHEDGTEVPIRGGWDGVNKIPKRDQISVRAGATASLVQLAQLEIAPDHSWFGDLIGKPILVIDQPVRGVLHSGVVPGPYRLRVVYESKESYDFPENIISGVARLEFAPENRWIGRVELETEVIIAE